MTHFKHPMNGYTVRATGWFPWLWAFLFGPLYFVYHGIWRHAVIEFFLCAILLSTLFPFVVLVWVAYALAAAGIVANKYRALGWLEVEPRAESQDAPAGSTKSYATAIVLVFFGAFGLAALLSKSPSPQPEPLARRLPVVAAVERTAVPVEIKREPVVTASVVKSAPPPAPPQPRIKGKPIDVPSDGRASYRAIEVGRKSGGRTTILTQRDGTSGRSFVLRECSCPVANYRVVGEGSTLAAARKPRLPPDDMAALVRKGSESISYHVCTYACRTAK